MFVAVGRNSIVLTSTDGISWMNRTVPLPVDFGRIAYGNGFFVAVNGRSANGVVIISTNAVDWTMHSTGAPYPFADITFAAGLFVGVSGSSVYSSTNGVQWTRHETQALYGLATVTYGADTFVVAGSQGAILQSDIYLPPIVVSGRWLGSQGFEISFDGEAGRHYRIQSSAGLAAWADLCCSLIRRQQVLHNGFIESFLRNGPTPTIMASPFAPGRTRCRGSCKV
jgi:hypothetical protein